MFHFTPDHVTLTALTRLTPTPARSSSLLIPTSSDIPMEDMRQRRTPRACAPCRRKKVKCPGERPTCSFCQRLGQPCDYRSTGHGLAPDPQRTSMQHRMDAVETKLDQVLHSLSTLQQQPQVVSQSIAAPTSGPSLDVLEPDEGIRIQPDNNSEPPYSEDHELLGAGQLYLTWSHNQPLFLFRKEGFLESLKDRDKELQIAIHMLARRFPPGHITLETQRALETLSKSCRKLVTDRIADGRVRLSTLQTLCLLSMINFADGRVMQAGLDLNMAQYFIASLAPSSCLGNPPEYSLCVQSIALLQSLQGSVPDLATTPNGLLELVNHRSRRANLLREPEPESNRSIHYYMSQASQVWQMARAYAASRVGPESLPPWNPQSDYSLVMAHDLELDCQFPLKYRFATNDFGGLNPEALAENRDYWGPWLFIQFVHAAIPTLLNHPFLLSLRLKNFRQRMPQTFMYQSFDLISKHTAWIICYLDLLEKKQFQVTDPVIAHCVVIVATIHLQHSFVKDDTLRIKAQHGYDKCMRFLDRIVGTWPAIFSMTQNLRKLQGSITTMPSMGAQGSQLDEPSQPWSIDAQLLWDILVYKKAGRDNASTDRSMFEDVITLEVEQQQDIDEYSLVGSAGMSGHKTALREISAYAPQDNDPYKPLAALATSRGGQQGAATLDERGFEAFGDLNSMDQGDFFLQAEDFGRAVNDWINFDMTDVM